MSIKDARFIPGTQGIYALSSVGTLSRFHMTPNPFSAPVPWQDTDLDNMFTRIVPELNGLNVYVQGTAGAVDPNIPAGEWAVVFLGTEVGRDVDGGGNPYIDVQADFYGPFGGYGMFLATADNDTCCTIVDINIISGSQNLGGSGWALCGEDLFTIDEVPPHMSSFINPPVGEVRELRLLSTSPITYRVTFDADCFGGFTGSATITQYSTDSGGVFDPIKVVGVLPSGGMDTQKIGSVAIAAAGSQTFKAVSGGVWGIYSGTLPAGSRPDAIFIPRSFGTLSNGGSDPLYLMGSGTVTPGNESLWIVRNSGASFEANSPKLNGTAGKIVSPSALSMNWNDDTSIFAIAEFNEGAKLCVYNGTLWHFSDLNTGANQVIARRGDTQKKQLFVSNQSVAGLVNNYQVVGTIGTLVEYDRNHLGNATQSIDVYG